MTKTKFISFIFVIIIIITGVGIVSNQKSNPNELDGFAQCLTDKGAKFYGAFWCTHCQAQKKMFGKSVKYLPYIECSSPDGQNQLDICKEAGIEGYPTWVFADDSRLSGEIPLETLAEKTECALSQ